jgi:hypothetical protein
MAYNRSKNSMKTNELLENTGTTQTGEQAPVQSIEVSEKAEKLMKKSVRYLRIGFWMIICFVVIGSVRLFISALMSGNVVMLIPLVFLVVALWGVTILKCNDYLKDYSSLIEYKDPITLEYMLDAQRKFYRWIILQPLILLGITLLLFLVGGVLNTDFTENDF